MAVARSNVEFEPVGIANETYKLIRNDYRFDVYAIDVWLAVYLAETILLIDRVIDFGYGISAACLFVDTLIERTVNRTDSVISYGIRFHGQILDFVLVKHAV